MLPSFFLFATDVLAAHDGIQLIARHWEVKCLIKRANRRWFPPLGHFDGAGTVMSIAAEAG